MKILLSNDDGIKARGLRALYNVVKNLGHEVHIVAPESQSSGCSHAISIATPVIPKRVWDNGEFYGIAVTGYPSDAASLGVNTLYPDVDMVLTGINLGHNAGPAMFYSGTVAAASEGTMAGKPSLAISFDSFNEKDMDGLEDRLLPFMPIFLGLSKEASLYNINIPLTPDIKGIKITRHFQGFYQDHYDKRVDPRGRDYYWLANGGFSKELNGNGHHPYPHDLETIEAGYISITPLRFDWTLHDELTTLSAQIAQHSTPTQADKPTTSKKTKKAGKK